MESQPISKKSHLTVQGAQSFWIANLLWQQCPTSYTHVAMSTGRLTFKCPDTYLRPYTPLWDVGVSQIFCPTLCATRRDLNLFLVVPCSPLLWLHNSVQASLNPSLTVNTLNFLLPTALSKHLFSIKPVTNIKVYCEQINLNIPTMASWKRQRWWSQRNKVESLTDCCIDVPTVYRLPSPHNPSRLNIFQHDGCNPRLKVVLVKKNPILPMISTLADDGNRVIWRWYQL